VDEVIYTRKRMFIWLERKW